MTLMLQSSLPEEDEEEVRSIFETNHLCPCCQDYVLYTDEVYLLEITEAAKDGNQIVSQPLMCDDGDYLYEPYILHFMCWEEVLEQMREITADQPPAESPDGILKCQVCESTIGNFEPFLAANCAEIHVSQRSPNGEKSDRVAKNGGMDAICLPCLVHVFDQHFEDWEDLFNEFNISMGDADDE